MSYFYLKFLGNKMRFFFLLMKIYICIHFDWQFGFFVYSKHVQKALLCVFSHFFKLFQSKNRIFFEIVNTILNCNFSHIFKLLHFTHHSHWMSIIDNHKIILISCNRLSSCNFGDFTEISWSYGNIEIECYKYWAFQRFCFFKLPIVF